jgi:PKD repeat protein
VHTYSNPGDYDVSLIVKSTSGCTDTVFKTVTVYYTPEAKFSGDYVCEGTPTQFYNQSKTEPGASFLWDFDDGYTSTVMNPVHLYDLPDLYIVKLTVTNHPGGCEDETTLPVFVYAEPDIQFSITDITNTKKQFIPSDSNQLTFHWDFGDGNTSTEISPVHDYQVKEGAFEVTVLAINTDACFSEYSDTAKVEAVSVFKERETLHSNIEVYPNPFIRTTTLYIDLEQHSSIRIELTDQIGRTISIIDQGEKSKGQIIYDINADLLGLASGIYNLRIYINNRLSVRKIVLSL